MQLDLSWCSLHPLALDLQLHQNTGFARDLGLKGHQQWASLPSDPQKNGMQRRVLEVPMAGPRAQETGRM